MKTPASFIKLNNVQNWGVSKLGFALQVVVYPSEELECETDCRELYFTLRVTDQAALMNKN